jgi:hypothetical protein
LNLPKDLLSPNLSRKIYQLIYSDGSRKHINRAERDNLILSGLAKRTDSGNYLFIGRQVVFHSFADLQGLADALCPKTMRRFLAGSFIVELNGCRRTELMETPESYVERLDLYNPSQEAE